MPAGVNGARIGDIPEAERPRERLIARGSAAISDVELVAVLLRSGIPGKSALSMAHEIMTERGGLVGMLGTQTRHLKRFGLGEAKAATVIAGVELGRRIAGLDLSGRAPLERPASVARFVALQYGRHLQEVVGALFLDARNRLVDHEELHRGTITRAVVEPRTVLTHALMRGACGVVLFHTHPSGDPTPSAEDVAFTRRLVEASEVVGVTMIDHLIVGHGGRWVSLKERGAW
jgi:DNA repair protein RadC